MKSLFVSSCALLAVVAGCGGDSAGTCANTPACGGNIVGTWKITSSCLTLDVGAMDIMTGCQGETASASGVAITGIGTYGADMTYTQSSTLTGNVIVNLPASCLTDQGMTVTCAQVTAALQPDLASTDFQSATCANAGGGCTCTLGIRPMISTVNGTYLTTAAGVLTEMDQGATTASTSDYCVAGTTLTESPHSGSGPMGQGSSLSGTITFTKQ